MQLRLDPETSSALRLLRKKYQSLAMYYSSSLTKLANGLLLDKISQELERFKKKQP